jgi:hydrogenase nickel incorporation protein HypA/HybF
MHEMSVCLALINEVERIAAERNAGSVSRIEVGIGPLSGVEAVLLDRAFPLAAAGTSAEHAELVIETTDIVVHCSQCDEESPARANRLLCGACGDYRTRIVSGEEMILQRVELSASPAARSLAS